MTLERNKHTCNNKNSSRIEDFWVTLFRFVQWDHQVSFQKSFSGLNDHKGPEDIDYTMVKLRETFYLRSSDNRSFSMLLATLDNTTSPNNYILNL